MIANRVTLDHVGLVVRDLDAAAARYRASGFRLTPRGRHRAPLVPGGAPVPWGSGNHCAMFAAGYFEILGVVDPAAYHAHIARRLADHEGLHLIALGCDDLEAVASDLAGRGIACAPVAPLARDVATEAGVAEARFRILRPEEAVVAGADLFFITHETPEHLWQPGLVAHPNGAAALAGVTLCSDDVGRTAARLARVLGVEGEASEGAVRFALGRGWIAVMEPRGFAARHRAEPAAVPAPAAATIAVADLASVATTLAAAGVAAERCAAGLRLAPGDAGGAVLVFAPQPRRVA